jgi:putative transcriptional regulator
MYHYTDSGLDNIYLVNGFNKSETAYGEAVAIDDIDGLHNAIGRWLINDATPITGAKLRF